MRQKNQPAVSGRIVIVTSEINVQYSIAASFNVTNLLDIYITRRRKSSLFCSGR